MSFRLEKNMRILDELVGFCCNRGARNIYMNINLEEKMTTITVKCRMEEISTDDLTFLNETLNSDRQHEVEECYWLVAGDDSFGDELCMTGIMTDEATVDYTNQVLTIIAKRLED